MPSFFQWITLGLGILGFLATWIVGAFYLGRAVEQIQSSIRGYIDDEIEKTNSGFRAMESAFDADQQTQDRNFGEVGAALRQNINDVEKKLYEVELYGRDNYVKMSEFEKAIDRMGETFAHAIKELKDDIRAIVKSPN